MDEFTGWLLDVYAGPVGVTLWLLGDDDRRRQFHHAFPVTFYAAGPFPCLRQLWAWLREHAPTAHPARERRRDLFVGDRDVLAITSPHPVAGDRLFGRVLARFPDLDYYDADIPLPLRYAAVHGLFPLARCRVAADGAGRIAALSPLDDPWEMDPPPPLRILTLSPDVDPALRPPTCLHVANDRGCLDVALHPPDLLLSTVHSLLRRHDPDLVLTRHGDTWLFPLLLAIQKRSGSAYFNPNRDPLRQQLGSVTIE